MNHRVITDESPMNETDESVPAWLHREAMARADAEATRLRSLLESEQLQNREIADRREQQYRQDLEAERQRHQAELARLHQAHRAVTNQLMANISRVLVANRRRPWWARLFGKSRLSG